MQGFYIILVIISVLILSYLSYRIALKITRKKKLSTIAGIIIGIVAYFVSHFALDDNRQLLISHHASQDLTKLNNSPSQKQVKSYQVYRTEVNSVKAV